MLIPARIEYISVRIDPESVPKGAPCPGCGNPLQITPQEYEFEDKNSKDPVVIKNTEKVPGYYCQQCGLGKADGLQLFDVETVTLLIDREILKKLPDSSNLKAPLQASVAITERSIKLRRAAKNKGF